MHKLSTGDDSNLGTYKKLSAAFFGQDSPATACINEKIAASPNGEQEEVLADERQMLMPLTHLALRGK